MNPTETITAHIARSRELEKNVTEGPWIHNDCEILAENEENIVVESPLYDPVIDCDNLDFIAASRTLLPQYVEAFSVALEALNKLPTYNRGEPEMKADALSKIAAILSPP